MSIGVLVEPMSDEELTNLRRAHEHGHGFLTSRRLLATVAARDGEIAARDAEIARLKSEAELDREAIEGALHLFDAQVAGATCAFCTPQDDGEKEARMVHVREHITKCEKHPLRLAEARVTQLREALHDLVQIASTRRDWKKHTWTFIEECVALVERTK